MALPNNWTQEDRKIYSDRDVMVKSVPSHHKQSRYWWKLVPLSVRSNYSWATETLYLMTCANPRLPGTSFFSPSVLYLHYTHSSPFNFRDSRKGPISAWDIKQVGSLWEWPPLKPALHSSIFPSDSSQRAMLTTVHVWRVVCFVQSNLGQRRKKL